MLNNTFGDLMDRVRFFFRKEKESYLRFYEVLGFYPRHIQYYEQAILHRSYYKQSDRGGLQSNERLEFLGDAVLNAVVADLLYHKFGEKREGFLTSTRSKMVSRESLNHVADEIGFSKLIKYTSPHLAHNCNMSGNAFEALIGAIYLDRGYDYCKYFIEHRIISVYLNVDKLSKKEVNFKSRLIEWTQKNKMEIAFELLSQRLDQSGSPVFESEVLIEGIQAGTGTAYSKKQSQQEAARQAWNKVKKDAAFMDKVVAAKAARKPDVEEPAVWVEKPVQVKTVQKEVPEAYRKSDDLEKLISEAEEAAFSELD